LAIVTAESFSVGESQPNAIGVSLGAASSRAELVRALEILAAALKSSAARALPSLAWSSCNIDGVRIKSEGNILDSVEGMLHCLAPRPHGVGIGIEPFLAKNQGQGLWAY